ncbi:MAG: hypothetical protein ACLFUJ_13825 [Phycisphaerae bacterium]
MKFSGLVTCVGSLLIAACLTGGCATETETTAALSDPVDSAVFQYALDFEYSRRDRKRTGRAHLWIPPSAQRVRGVVMAGFTSMERRFVKNGRIRRACASRELAIVFLDTGLSAAEVPELLRRFGDVSGYAELPRAPLLFVGHSAGGPQARDLAIQYAERCFGLIQHRGGLANGVPAEVPAIASVGQFDEFAGQMRDETGYEPAWQRALDATKQMRAEQPDKLVSFLLDAGAGHFHFSDREAEYLAMWIVKAAEARIPDGWASGPHPGQGPPVECVDLDPAGGWLTDLDLRDPKHAPAPADEYTGDVAEAGWQFDEQLARAHVAFHAARPLDRKDQFLTWQDRTWIDVGTRIFLLDPEWVDDGQTFRLQPAYRDTVPEQHKGRGPKWPRAGEPAGHSDAPIDLSVCTGPLVRVGPRKLRMQFDALNRPGERMRAFFIAFSPGDAEYRYTEHVGFMPRGFTGLTKGKDQTITFGPIDDLAADSGPMDLQAVSDSGLPVEYYVESGPARVVDGRLKIADLPARAKYPIEVRVVAYQFGSGIEPRVKSAEPVTQTFRITQPK